jgi:hypothetical protein
MKKYLLILVLFVIYAAAVFAQSSTLPSNQINLQAVARNTNGTILASRPITLKVSLLEGSATGTPVWVEQSSVTSNQFGIINYAIGSGSPVGAFTYANVNWATKKFIKLEIDPAGGLNFVTLSTEELKSVPVSNMALSASSLSLPIDQTVSNTTASGLTIRSNSSTGLAGVTTKGGVNGVFGWFIGDANNDNGVGVYGQSNRNGIGALGYNTEKGTVGYLGHPSFAGYFTNNLSSNAGAFGAFQIGAGNTGLEIHSTAAGLPYIDFAKDLTRDFDMRLSLEATNSLLLQGGQFRIQGSKLYGSSISFAFLTRGTSLANSTGLTSDNTPYSLVTDDRVLALQFHAFSDKRIKKDLKLSKNDNDLNVLSKLEVTDYRHIDFVSKGDAYKKGFIAQQVETIFPEAVSKGSDYIPNIYKPVKKVVVENETLNIEMTEPHGLVKGDKVRFYVKDKMHELEVANTEGSSFTINNWKNGEANEVFVYGKQVNDFRTVDYDRIFTLNVSATQALIKRNQDLEKRIADLEKYNNGLENNLKNLEGKVSSILKQLNTDGTSRENREGGISAEVKPNSSTSKPADDEK